MDYYWMNRFKPGGGSGAPTDYGSYAFTGRP
jgi:hypothetical protein